MQQIARLKEKIFHEQTVTKEEALALYEAPLVPLNAAADEIRRRFCGNRFDLCAIVNAKSGRCGEDCKFCAQSSRYPAEITAYPLLSQRELLRAANAEEQGGVKHFGIVTSGKSLSAREMEKVCRSIETLKRETSLVLCASLGLLSESQLKQLKAAGITRIHNNLETSRRFFPQICTSHSYDDKIKTISAARRNGLEVCSGGIFGLGETVEDRIELALTLRELEIKSVPLNILEPIPGTPLEKVTPLSEEEVRRMVTVFRFLLPNAFLRLAGGRGNLKDKGRACFSGGANAAITGDMLTTKGISAAADLEILKELGYEVS